MVKRRRSPLHDAIKDTMFADYDPAVTRREFLGMTAASLLMAGSLSGAAKPDTKSGIPYRTLGRTGEKVSLIGLGGYHLGNQSDPEESIRIIRTGIDEGINFLDNCWDYNGGESEIRMGKALRDGYRQKAFLMTKIDGRNKTAATTQLNESLRRLQTDRIDLLQFHEVIRDSDPDRIFAEGGGMEAVAGSPKGGQDPFYRLHRPQESRHSFEDAGHRLKARIHVRCRSDASQRDGRPLQQFRKEGLAGVDRGRSRSSRHETDGR